jgi:hypothetical protein
MFKFWKRRSNTKVKARGSRSLYQMKGLARRNTHVKYQSLTTYQSKVMTKVKVYEKGQIPGQRSKRVKVIIPNERSC